MSSSISKIIVLILGPVCIAIALLAILFVAADYGNRRAITDTEAVVVHKKFARPKEAGQSPYMIIIARDTKVWTVRVSRRFYQSVRAASPTYPGDRILLTRKVGLLTGFTYNYMLAQQHQPIPITQTEELTP
ncbi:hypothetical protein [Halalkalibaculum sp. DA384]|uniref:hypothetical protein n=1 Tax=Halalkalibaculum sp. DA384 TaxID=3373606 RepID=UPI003754E586